MKEKHIIAYLKTAQVFADCSTAQRLHVGAICVKDDKIISIGYNGTPSGWSNLCEDESGRTLPHVIHAEANCIMKLAKTSGQADGSIMFCTHSPCVECAKLIAGSGISKVYYIEAYRSLDGINLLKQMNVDVEQKDLDKL